GAKLVSHIVGDRSRTINARDDGNIIARSRSPARTGVALEVTHLLWRMEIHRAGIDAKLVITPEIFEHEVVGMNMFPGTNMASREANDLAVLFYRRSVSKLQQGDFMAGRDVLANAQMDQVVRYFLARFYWTFQHRDTIRLPKQNRHVMEVSLRHLNRVIMTFRLINTRKIYRGNVNNVSIRAN